MKPGMRQAFERFAEESVRFVESLQGEMDEEVDFLEEAQRSARIIESLTKKWTVPIIYFLYQSEELGFTELATLLDGISSRTLSLRLKSLQKRGWVHREVTEDRPPRVRYSLTEKGDLVAMMAGPLYLFIRMSEE